MYLEPNMSDFQGCLTRIFKDTEREKQHYRGLAVQESKLMKKNFGYKHIS